MTTTDTVKKIGFFMQLQNKLQEAVRQGNERKLELRKPDGETLFGLNLNMSIALAFFLLFTSFVPLVFLSIIILMVMKYQFVILKKGSPSS